MILFEFNFTWHRFIYVDIKIYAWENDKYKWNPRYKSRSKEMLWETYTIEVLECVRDEQDMKICNGLHGF